MSDRRIFGEGRMTTGWLTTIAEGKNKRKRGEKPTMYLVINFTSPSAPYLLLIRFTSLPDSLPSSRRNYQPLKSLATLSEKPWEVSDVSQRSGIFLAGTKTLFAVVHVDTRCCEIERQPWAASVPHVESNLVPAAPLELESQS